MGGDITVSVLLPNYNHAHHLPTALRALAAQARPADEIIVVDDASTDDSVRVIEGFAQTLPQMRLIKSAENGGVNRATDIALASARSSHVVCTAADDWLEPNFILRMTEALARFPAAPLCISAFVEYDELSAKLIPRGADSDLGCWYAPNGMRFVSAEEFQQLLDRRFVWLPVSSALFARDALRNIGGLDPALKWHADWFAIYTLALRSGFAVVPEPLAVFRVSPTTFSGRGIRNAKDQRAVSLAIYEKLKRPEFRDVYAILARHPAAFSTTFLRQLLVGLLWRWRDWPFLASLLRWWLREVARGRRPGFLRDLLGRGIDGER